MFMLLLYYYYYYNNKYIFQYLHINEKPKFKICPQYETSDINSIAR